jgi:hypothetical protein
MSAPATTKPTTTLQKRKAELSAEERKIIDLLEQGRDQPMTEQQINLALDQARAIGEL